MKGTQTMMGRCAGTTQLQTMALEANGDVMALLRRLGVPEDLGQAEKDVLVAKLRHVLDGDVEKTDQVVTEMGSAAVAPVLMAVKGGTSRFATYWWGAELCISHELLRDACNLGSFVSFATKIAEGIAASGGLDTPGAGLITAFLFAVGFDCVVLRVIDAGNGVVIKKPWIGPAIPLRQ